MAPPKAQQPTADVRSAARARPDMRRFYCGESPDFPMFIIHEHLRQMSGDERRCPAFKRLSDFSWTCADAREVPDTVLAQPRLDRITGAQQVARAEDFPLAETAGRAISRLSRARRLSRGVICLLMRQVAHLAL